MQETTEQVAKEAAEKVANSKVVQKTKSAVTSAVPAVKNTKAGQAVGKAVTTVVKKVTETTTAPEPVAKTMLTPEQQRALQAKQRG